MFQDICIQEDSVQHCTTFCMPDITRVNFYCESRTQIKPVSCLELWKVLLKIYNGPAYKSTKDRVLKLVALMDHMYKVKGHNYICTMDTVVCKIYVLNLYLLSGIMLKLFQKMVQPIVVSVPREDQSYYARKLYVLDKYQNTITSVATSPPNKLMNSSRNRHHFVFVSNQMTSKSL